MDTPVEFASRNPPATATSFPHFRFSAFQPCGFPWDGFPWDFLSPQMEPAAPLRFPGCHHTCPTAPAIPSSILPTCPIAFIPSSCSQKPQQLLGFHKLTQGTLSLITPFLIPCLRQGPASPESSKEREFGGGWSCPYPSKNQRAALPGMRRDGKTPQAAGEGEEEEDDEEGSERQSPKSTGAMPAAWGPLRRG